MESVSMNKKMHITIVDDEKVLAKKIKKKFENNGYIVSMFKGYQDFMQNNTIRSSLYVIDISLGDGNGFDIIDWLKNKKQYPSPILILSGYGETDKVIYGLNMGADDYIIKPCMPEELIARAKALMRRSGDLIDQQNIEYKWVIYDFDKIGVFIWGERVSLTMKETMAVELFMRNIGKVLSREQLINYIWWDKSHVSVTDNTINVTISNIRKKIGIDFEIKNIYSHGYVLM